MSDWYYIDEHRWAYYTWLAGERDKLSDQATNTRRWSDSFNLIGLIGEALFSALSGQPLNVEIAIRDGGEDFPGVDVKASTHPTDPWLKTPAWEKLKAPNYWLAHVDLGHRAARPCGWATRSMMAAAPVIDLKYGPSHVLREAELLTADAIIPLLYQEAR